jgi:hypothetical protein
VQDDPRVPGQPGPHVRVLVGAVVIHHDVQLAARVSPGDLAQEPEELFGTVAGIAGLGHLAGGDL